MDRRIWLVGLLGWGSLLSPWSDSIAIAEPEKAALTIVTRKDSSLDGLTIRELKRAYLGERVQDPDGTVIVPFNHGSSSPERAAFERIVLGMSADELGRFWIDRKIRGQPGGPKSVPSAELLRRVVATVPGAITYFAKTELGADLKIVAIDGKRPGQPDYPLAY